MSDEAHTFNTKIPHSWLRIKEANQEDTAGSLLIQKLHIRYRLEQVPFTNANWGTII
jgi:hypothetical protein